MLSRKLLGERTLTSFGVSIGTGLMLESLFKPTEVRYDTTRDIPKNIKIDSYKYHYYNIYTIARNIKNSIQDRANVGILYTNNNLLDTVIEEVNTINALYENSKCMPILFIPTYDDLIKKINKGKDGNLVNTDYLLREYIKNSINGNTVNTPMKIATGKKHLLGGDNSSMLITTHIPVDLLNFKKSKNLKLMESHTGKLKIPREWYSKYHKIGKLPLEVFPFMEELVYILGDGVISLPMKLNIRLDILTALRRNDLLSKAIIDFKPGY